MQSLVIRFIRWMQGCFRNFAIVCCLTLIAGLAATTPADAVIRRVDHESQATNPDGDPWTDSYPFLSDALADADPGDVIWLADGVYKPDQNANIPDGSCDENCEECDRTASFKLKKDVVVLGGFQGLSHPSGGETAPDRRDPETWKSVLSGDLCGDDADTNENGIPDGFEADPPDYSDMAENSYHICSAISIPADPPDPAIIIGPSTILDGVWVRGANANGGVFYDILGGGLFCGGPPSDQFITSSPTVARTRFEFNHAGNEESPTAGGYAAAIYSSYGDPVLRDLCTFADNHAKTCAGATILDAHGDFTVLGCTYQNNRAGKNSGAHQSRSQTGTTKFHSCQFIGNTVVGEQANMAGAIMLLGTAGELLNTQFRGNLAPREGGAARIQNTTVTNCTFSGNQTTDATSGRPGTGGIYAVSAVSIKNTILWGNTSNNGTTLQQQINGPPGSWQCSTTYSDIQGWCSLSVQDCEEGPDVDCDDGVDDETQNRDQDPEFKGTDNLRLTSCSPCIDKGLNSAVPLDEFDLDDDGITDTGSVTEATPDVDIMPRILNGDDTIGTVVDIGAYEYDPECPADLYPDGDVEGLDLAILLGAWTGQEVESPCPDEDLSGDCRVNGFDLAIVLGAWGDCEGVCNQDFGGGGGGGGEEEEDGTIDQLVAWYLAGDMAAIIQWLIEQGY